MYSVGALELVSGSRMYSWCNSHYFISAVLHIIIGFAPNYNLLADLILTWVCRVVCFCPGFLAVRVLPPSGVLSRVIVRWLSVQVCAVARFQRVSWWPGDDQVYTLGFAGSLRNALSVSRVYMDLFTVICDSRVVIMITLCARILTLAFSIGFLLCMLSS
jgi:hypothetical protein